MKVFVSHSRHDTAIMHHLQEATPLLGIHETILYEELPPASETPDADRIINLIEESDALLAIQTSTTENLEHTTHWIQFECAIAAANRIPIILVRDRHLSKKASIPFVTDYAEVDFDAPSSITTIQHALKHHTTQSILSYPIPRAGAFMLAGSAAGPLGTVAGLALAKLTQQAPTIRFEIKSCRNCRRPIRLWTQTLNCPSCAKALNTTEEVDADASSH